MQWIWLTLLLLGAVALDLLIRRFLFSPATTKVESKRLVDHLQLRALVRQEAAAHGAYEHDRVHARKRPGWHPDQRITVVAQRVVRELHRLGLEGDLEEIKALVRKEVQ